MSTETTTGTGARPPPDSLLPGELRERIPALYATQDDADPTVQAKLFTPWTTWTWFVTEFDGQEACFGLVSGHEVEQPIDLYEMIRQRYEHGAMIVTSNRALEEWYPLFVDDLMASAAMDRLLHHAHVVVIEGHSYRNPPGGRKA